MELKYQWRNTSKISTLNYICGHCSVHVGPSEGFIAVHRTYGDTAHILICSNCSHPTFFSREKGQVPGAQYGIKVNGITNESIESLYDEARKSFAANAYTGCVMIARKILMNLAVQNGAEENLSFVEYVNFLDKNGWVPPNGKKWVDQIRLKGNEANHQLVIMSKEDAEQVMRFLSMLLQFAYELVSP